jgi:hypothetical protein
MSWSTFKSTMVSQMESGVFGKNTDAFAKAFTLAYYSAIKSGKEIINPIPLAKGNTTGMEAQLKQLLNQTVISKSSTLLDVIGVAVITYWTGAIMQSIPPITPAPGAIKNITLTQGLVLNPGNWTTIVVPTNNNVSIFLDAFINSAKIHLTTVSGLYIVLAQYPPPAPPAPGVLNWSGYIISD